MDFGVNLVCKLLHIHAGVKLYKYWEIINKIALITHRTKIVLEFLIAIINAIIIESMGIIIYSLYIYCIKVDAYAFRI